MKTKATIASILALLSITGRVFAQSAPPPVTGVTAQALNGQVVVQWNAVTSVPIDYYRVYYSNYSILENDGLYDDFEATEDDAANLTFVPPAHLDDLYIAVIAVASSGAESEYFTEETYVKVSTGGPTQPTPQPSSENPDVPEVPQHTTLKLLKGTVVSPTEIQVEFSTSVTVDSQRAPEGLAIARSDGSQLGIKGITIQGKTITIETETQERGTVYNVQFSEPFVGKNGQPLDTDDRSVLLTGHADGTEPQVRNTANAQPGQATPRTADPYNPPDLQNVSIVPQLQPNGAYTVTLEWNAVDNTPGDIYGIVAYQTRDGQTFGPPSLLPVDIRGVQLKDVTPGFFGLYLQTVNVYGVTSPGVFQYATLPVYVPGYGLQGNLTFGSLQNNDDVNFDAVADESEATGDMATLKVMDKDTDTKPLEEATKLAAEEQTNVDWESAGILATAIAGTIVLLVGLFVMLSGRTGSTEL